MQPGAAPSYHELVAVYRQRATRTVGRAERLPDVGDALAYNPCLIEQGDDTYLAVRVESRASYWRRRDLWDPRVRFYRRVGADWVPAPGTPVIPASEDPFAAWVRDRDGRPVLVFGVVSLDFRHDPPGLVTRFHAAPDVAGLDPAGPLLEVPGMKDIRLLQRPEGLAVCGRPQGGPAGLGRMSLAMVDDYTRLTAEVVNNAHVFGEQVAPDTKIGVNELYDLGDHIGVLGHVAIGLEGEPQHYAAAWWTVDPVRLTAGVPEVIAVRDDFPAGPAKWPTVADVVFPGSLAPVPGGRVRLYCGLSDASVGSATMGSPFPPGR